MYKVLYVDDEPALLDLGKTFLELSGSFTVEIALSAEEGIQELKKTAFDSIISDYQMPGMDGLEFLKFLRKENNRIPFILFTGRGREEVVIDAVNNGVDYYLQKGGDPKSQFVELEHKIKLAIERRRTEIAFIESEERYRAVVEDQTEFISRFLPDGTHVFVNEAYCRYFSKKPEEIIGTRFRPDIRKEDMEDIRVHFRSLTQQHPFATIEHRIIMHDGTIRWQQWSDRAIFNKDGHIREYQSVGRDITEQKRAEDELRAAYEQITAVEEELRTQFDELKDREQAIGESERKLQGIVQGSPIPQFVIDKNHRVVSWNRALEEHSGIMAKEVVGTTYAWKAFYDKERPVLSNLLVENKLEEIPELYAGKFNKSKYVDGAYEAIDFFPRMGGHGIWLYFTAAVLRDSKGSIVGAVETLEDITDRKKAEDELRASNEQITATEEELRHQFDELKKSEDALRESEEKYRNILENTQDVYYRSDTAGNLILASPSAAQLLGYNSVSELIGKNIAQTIYCDPEERSKLLAEISTKGSVKDYEVTLKKRDGTPVPVATSSHKYFDPTGHFLGVEGIFRDITERKRMEESLRANEEKYRSLVDNLNVGIYRNTVGFPDRWLWVNPAFVKMLGYDSLHECLEHPVTDIYANPEERREIIHMLETNDFIRNRELQLKKKNGSLIWVSVTAQPKRNTDGTIAWVDGICDDITALKEAEASVRHHQFEMSRAIDYLPDATFIIDRKGTVIAWNRAIEEMTGIRASDIIGKGDFEYAIPFYGQHRPILIDLIFAPENEIKKGDYLEIKRTGEIISVETPNPILKGKPAVVRAIAAPIYDENGNVAGAIETITDITELKRAQEDLTASENRYRTIFENTGTATVLIDENTIISIANAEFERLSGFPRAELEGKKNWTEFVLPEDLERMLAQHHMRREMQETALRHYEFRFVTKTGEIHNIFLTIDVIPGTKQSVASLMDITAQIQAQDAFRQANRKLNLLNNITRHDILNSLSALIGNLQISRQITQDPEVLKYIAKEELAAESIHSQILFTRDYQDVGIHSPEWQQVEGTIQKSIISIPLKDIILSVDVGGSMEIFADLLLEKVFYTLVENAIRHGKTVTKIRFITEEAPDTVKIICEDNGRGIPAEVKEQIFKREYYQHTGLGLFLAREILGITGISISETGEPGNGARFEITVPKGMYRGNGRK
jgi:PAS domain S-box-containing protein